jgi:hypothetical protein
VTSKTRQGQWLALTGAAAVAVLFGIDAPSAEGYPRYRQNQNGGYCVECHGHFIDNTSPQGTQFPGQGKMGMHMDTMGTDCFLCHTEIGDVPETDSSAGTAHNPGLGCTGCHGRVYADPVGVSAVGLRRHHVMSGISVCLDCGHGADPAPLPENAAPVYYNTPDTLVTDPCNPFLLPPDVYGENFSLDTDNVRGQDNDGDNQYDENDADCGGCPWDCGEAKDGQVGVNDFLAMLAQWGQIATSCDFGSGTAGVDVSEFLELLGNWGPCS